MKQVVTGVLGLLLTGGCGSYRTQLPMPPTLLIPMSAALQRAEAAGHRAETAAAHAEAG